MKYSGIRQDICEGQGVVAHGRLQNGTFVADVILAKHDENTPPEVARSLRTITLPPEPVAPDDPELGHFAPLRAGPRRAGLFNSRARLRDEEPCQAGCRRQFVLVSTAIGALMYAFVTFDFSVLYVASNSTRRCPPSIAWPRCGAHEGSLLLWRDAARTLAVAIASRNLPAIGRAASWACSVS